MLLIILQQMSMNCQVEHCFSFRMVILFSFVACLQHVQTLCLVGKSNIPKLGHGLEVRACYPNIIVNLIEDP